MTDVEDDPTDSVPASQGPLTGVRVLDFTFMLPGAYGTQLLSDMGAEVIKVEPIEGEPGRTVLEGNFWYSANRNKHSLTVNLKDLRGQAVCQELAAVCDVVLEGFRPGTVNRLGVDYATLSQVNPRIVYCSISGFGQQGPLRDEPGHDVNYLATGGGLAVSGHWGERPRRSGMPVADLGSGAFGALAICAALLERGRTGQGTYIDLAMRDVSLSFASSRSGLSFGARVEDQIHLQPMNDVFVTLDGTSLALGIVEPRFWVSFATAVRDLAPDLSGPDYETHADRRRNGDQLKRRLAELFATQSVDFWMELLVPADVPAQPVLGLADALEHPQSAARGVIQEVGGQRFMAFPALFDGRALPVRSVAPGVGEQTREVLNNLLGWDDARIDRLIADGVLA